MKHFPLYNHNNQYAISALILHLHISHSIRVICRWTITRSIEGSAKKYTSNSGNGKQYEHSKVSQNNLPTQPILRVYHGHIAHGQSSVTDKQCRAHSPFISENNFQNTSLIPPRYCFLLLFCMIVVSRFNANRCSNVDYLASACVGAVHAPSALSERVNCPRNAYWPVSTEMEENKEQL